MSNASPSRTILVQDAVHGPLSLLCCQQEFCATPHFQRLARLAQLGFAHYVYPGANHTRAEHSLGVAGVVRQLLHCVRRNQPDVQVTERDERLLVLAGLAHDIGHGAFSHSYESWLHTFYTPKDGVEWTHEEQSGRLMRDMIARGLLPSLKDDAAGVERVLAFIAGTLDGCTTLPHDEVLPRNKRWMLDVVNNARCGIDVDKLDYLERDPYHALGGAAGLLSTQRIVENVRVSRHGRRLMFHKKLADTLYELFHRRWSLFRTIYQHNTVVGIELMMHDLMTHLYRSRHFSFLRKVVVQNKVDDYLLLDDSLVQQARVCWSGLTERERANDSNLGAACALADRIERRRLYRVIARCTVRSSIWASMTDAQRSALFDMRWMTESGEYVANEFVVHKSFFHYGNGDQNPLDNVTFFDWQGNEYTGDRGAHASTRMLPRRWSEVLVRVYSKAGLSDNDSNSRSSNGEKISALLADFFENLQNADIQNNVPHKRARKSSL